MKKTKGVKKHGPVPNESNPFLYNLGDELIIDDIGNKGVIVSRCETADDDFELFVTFYLVIAEDGENIEITQKDLIKFNTSECEHKWAENDLDLSTNICVRCKKEKPLGEVN